MKIKCFFLAFLIFFSGKKALSAVEVTFQPFAYGVKLDTSFCQLSYYQKSDSKNYGFALWTDAFWKTFPCTFKCGSISARASFSSLKNPSFTSTITPFGSVKSGVNCLTSVLNSYSSFPDEFSIFSEFAFVNKKVLPGKLKLNSFYAFESKEMLLSFYKDFKINKKNLFSLSLTYAHLPYGDRDFSSWFNHSDYYFHGGKLDCLDFQNCLKLNNLVTSFKLDAYLSPLGKVNCLFKSENKLALKHFIFTLSAFYNPYEDVFLADKSFLDPLLQVRGGLQYKNIIKMKNPLFFKAGLNNFVSINLMEKSHTLKTAAGFQVSASLFSAGLSSLTSLKLDSSGPHLRTAFSSEKITLTNIIYLDNTNLSLQASFTFSNASSGCTFSHRYSSSCVLGKKIIFSSAFSQDFKGGNLYSSALNFGIKATYKVKVISINAKAEVKLQFAPPD